MASEVKAKEHLESVLEWDPDESGLYQANVSAGMIADLQKTVAAAALHLGLRLTTLENTVRNK